jgi:hypothetical protein
MKNVVLVSLMMMSMAALSSCHKHKIKGEGNIISDTRSLADITSVTADGDLEIEILPAKNNKVIITGYENLVPAFESNVSNGRLTLRFNDTYYNVRNNNIKVTLYVNGIEGVTLNGSGKITMLPGIKTDNMEVKINGSGKVTLEENYVSSLNCHINGSGDIFARDFEAESVDAKISGSGNMELTVIKYLEARISGSGTINYWGSPETVNTDISGSGKVKKH